MKFTEFRKLIEKYKELILQNKIDDAKEILKIVDPQGLGLKRFFVVKKHRVEKIVEQLAEDKNLHLRYKMLNITNRGYDFIVTINNDQKYIIRCNTKKAVGYVHLKSLYREPDFIDGVNNLVKDYPEILDGLWKAVLDTSNEKKRREIVSIEMKIRRTNQEQEYINKERNMITQLIKQLQEDKQEIIDSLDDIKVEDDNINKV